MNSRASKNIIYSKGKTSGKMSKGSCKNKK